MTEQQALAAETASPRKLAAASKQLQQQRHPFFTSRVKETLQRLKLTSISRDYWSRPGYLADQPLRLSKSPTLSRHLSNSPAARVQATPSPSVNLFKNMRSADISGQGGGWARIARKKMPATLIALLEMLMGRKTQEIMATLIAGVLNLAAPLLGVLGSCLYLFKVTPQTSSDDVARNSKVTFWLAAIATAASSCWALIMTATTAFLGAIFWRNAVMPKDARTRAFFSLLGIYLVQMAWVAIFTFVSFHISRRARLSCSNACAPRNAQV
ncbi:hypothetical protein WJX74_002793 [Apatococcus lobatus]|uniref:Uncharacterized protein n=1 Tax=Apatococcus lobatus TaxID=904363 RepID=A0AAW1QAS9_9CHLO